MVSFIEDVLKAFKGFADTQQVIIKNTLPEDSLVVGFDPDKMEKILFNLLSNAIKFSPLQGIVEVNVKVDKKQLVLSICDQGKGIEPERMEKFFNRFESEGGVGIGLSLTRELVHMHGGTIIYKHNSLGQGSVFEVTLPIASYKTHEESEKVIFQAKPVALMTDKKQTLLIAEDNRELRLYIASIFTGYFNVLQAEDGKQALEICQKYLPDMIIADLMMPYMDGITLCRRIKTNIETSHIPLVLLTAYTDIQHQLSGSEAGADLYIPKPFDEELLRTNVVTILNNRQRVKEKYSSSFNVEMTSLVTNNLDKDLVKRLTNYIEKNIDDSDLNVDRLAIEIGLSRSQLTRKLNTLAGMAPGLFIQNYRLKKAAALLKQTTQSVSEIAYQTGFSDPKYFSRNFKKLFGVSPSDYRI
ncbi:MAG: response regulator [Marinilabiliaceae bacterium]|nr:response regulator [Marinilabiliaceae bacterium]